MELGDPIAAVITGNEFQSDIEGMTLTEGLWRWPHLLWLINFKVFMRWRFLRSIAGRRRPEPAVSSGGDF